MNQPAPALPPQLRELVARHGARAVSGVEQSLRANLRPCLWVQSERVGRAPLRRSWAGRLLRLETHAPRLPLLRSKLGGTPYATAALPTPRGHHFLGQLNFAELPPCIPELPRQGLLGMDLSVESRYLRLRTRWYPQPHEAEALPAGSVHSVGRFEAALHFRCGASLPRGDGWEQLLPAQEPELVDAWNEWEPQGFFDDERDRCHRLGGHRSLEPDALGDFHPPEGGPNEFREYEQLLRLTYDNAAGFGWGTNWLYLLIHPEDLRQQRFERIGFATANA